MVKLNIFDGCVWLRAVPIMEACPERDDCDAVLSQLKAHGYAWMGGGAAPLLYIVEHKDR